MRRTVAVLAGALAAAATLASPALAAKATCDAIDPRACLLPWPNDHFTAADARTDTGRRLSLPVAGAFRNAKGVRMDLRPYATGDGFSAGSPILTLVPGLDLAKTGAAPITDIGRSLSRSAPIALIDAKTRKRHPIWAEIDTAAPQGEQLLMIHPARNLTAGRRYIVALRNLRDASGRAIAPGRAFRSLRDGKARGALRGRQRSFDALFRTLAKAGVRRSSLTLAWDFTVASRRNVTERMLAIRDDAFAQLGDRNLRDRKVAGRAPAFKIDKVETFRPCGADGCQDGEDDDIARRITGTMTVPCYLDAAGCPTGSRFAFARQRKGRFAWVPKRRAGNVMQATFHCGIPYAALERPARPSLYGHGLLGRSTEVFAGNVRDMSQEHDMVFCATPEIGMAEEDVPTAIDILGEMGRFPALADRLQQGMLNGLHLGRLMIHPQGLVSDPAFRNASGAPVLDTSELYYDGNSQGGIFGGGLTAVAPDFERAVLGVPGMNYSLLLPRSVDFDTYEAIFKPAYPRRMDRIMILALVQNLWDRGEANGYAAWMTSRPLPDTPRHQVLLDVALGDHQVAQVSAENEARTIGAGGRRPVYDAGRSFDRVPLYGIPTLKEGDRGSSIVIWDSGPIRDGGALGTDVAPLGAFPPRAGNDPHELVRRTVAARRQKSEWLKPDGRFTDVCPPARACRVDGWPY